MVFVRKGNRILRFASANNLGRIWEIASGLPKRRFPLLRVAQTISGDRQWFAYAHPFTPIPRRRGDAVRFKYQPGVTPWMVLQLLL